MAIETLYKGESRLKTLTLKASGTPIPHANILGLRVFLVINGVTVLRFMKDEGDGAEAHYKLLTQHADPGKYQFAIEGEESATFPEGRMTMEVYRKTAQQGLDHLAKVFTQVIYNVNESAFNTQE